MEHGPDTEKLLRQISNIKNNRLELVNLAITSLPKLPNTLIYLRCDNCPLTYLPSLPESLEQLECYGTNITQLPSLPTGLKVLFCANNKVQELPSLPKSLKQLYCTYTQVKELPPLPRSLKLVYCVGSPLILKIDDKESIADYEARWIPYREEKAARLRCQGRCLSIKEDLIAEVMHPRRIEKLLELGGFDTLEQF